MIERVAGILTRYNMIRPGQRVGVAVSGGADSVCLLHLLRELAPRWNLRLEVLHVDHGLRGEESREDAGFVRRLASEFGIPYHEERASLEAGENLEQAARQARYGFFRQFLERGSLDRVALGHTRSDQAETVLFRFLRGSGTAGLAAIRPVTSEGFVRPLLEVERSEIQTWLVERGIRWREDSTNVADTFARNRIRAELLPQLTREWNPNLPATLAHMADWALHEEAYWEHVINDLAEKYLLPRGPAVLLRVDSLRGLPVAAARRLVRRALELVKGDLRSVEFHHVRAILELVSILDGHGRLQVPGVDVFRSFEWLRLAPPATNNLEDRNYRFPLEVPGQVRLPDTGAALHVEVVENSETAASALSGYNDSMGLLDWERVSGALAVRNWRPGDQYRPLGHASEEKIKHLFQEARIPLWERRHWPLLVDSKQILWARRFGPAADCAALPETRQILAIHEVPEDKVGICVDAPNV